MSDIREQFRIRIDLERQYAKEYFDVEFKAVGYLLAAHAAALGGCVALLKDYANVPQVKGIGVFIFLFGSGFIFAVIGYMTVTLHRQAWLGSFFNDRQKKANPNLYALAALIPNCISCLLLCLAIVIVIAKFARL